MLSVILWTLLAASGADFLDKYERRDGPTGPVYSHGWPDAEVRWAENHLRRELDKVEDRLGRRRGKSFVTVLVGDYREFRRVVEAVGGEAPDVFTRGVAFPGRSIIVIRGDLLRSAIEDPKAVTITHEVAHLVLHRRLQTQLPRWLDEGIAVWVSRGHLAPRDEAYLSLLARANGLYRLETLERAFPPGHHASALAYQQSFLMVSFLATQFGDRAVLDLLDLLEAGTPSSDALARVTGLSPPDIEKEFTRWTATRTSIFWSLLAIFNPWTFAALLALVAIARYVVRRRRRLREMGEEEGE